MSWNCNTQESRVISEFTVDPVGTVLSLVCILCWSKVIRKECRHQSSTSASSSTTSAHSNTNNSNMFKYLLVKAVCDFCTYPLNLPALFYYCKYGMCDNIDRSLSFNIFYSFIFEPISLWLELTSSLLDLAATLDCLLSITDKFRFAKTKMAFYLITLSTVLIGFAFDGFEFFMARPVEITQVTNLSTNETLIYSTYSFYSYAYTAFEYGQGGNISWVLYYSFRDCFVFILLIIANTLILVQIRIAAKRRAFLTGEESASSLAAHKAEQRKCIMIVLLSISYMGFNIEMLVWIFKYSFFYYPFSPSWRCFHRVAWQLATASYALPFFFYYAFNLRFRKAANAYAKMPFYPIRRLCFGQQENSPEQGRTKRGRSSTLTQTAANAVISSHHAQQANTSRI